MSRRPLASSKRSFQLSWYQSAKFGDTKISSSCQRALKSPFSSFFFFSLPYAMNTSTLCREGRRIDMPLSRTYCFPENRHSRLERTAAGSARKGMLSWYIPSALSGEFRVLVRSAGRQRRSPVTPVDLLKCPGRVSIIGLHALDRPAYPPSLSDR